MKLDLYSVNVSKPTTVLYKGKAVPTAIDKRAVSGPVQLRKEQLDGDEQADKLHHGGEDKAICAYFFDHYPYWEGILGKPLQPGAFGENFTLLGGSEREVRIGDVFRLGSQILLQVTQPRMPCFKLSAMHERPTLEQEVAESGFTGFYLRVLELGEGQVQAGAALTLEVADPNGMTIEAANAIMNKKDVDKDHLRRLLAVDALAESWRSQLNKRLL